MSHLTDHVNGEGGSRTEFVHRIAKSFDDANVNYVVLHAYGRDSESDSDVDVAVDRHSLNVVDTLIRSGTFGRVVQCLHYADPWCRYYVLESPKAGRRYRQLDIVCDPWGIGKDGKAIEAALAHPARLNGVRIAAPAAQTVYLAVKKARKREPALDVSKKLLAPYAPDPVMAATLLEKHFGRAGAALGVALREGQPELENELRGIRVALRRQRCRPRALVLRAYFSARRVCGRLHRATGMVVTLTGPDGVGKSTVAHALQHGVNGAFRRTVTLHFRPGLFPAPGRLLGRERVDGAHPHRRPASGRVGSIVRLVYLWLDSLLGWWPKVAIPRVRSGLVIFERGWLDVVVDPVRYRLAIPTAIGEGLAKALPRPDLMLRLDAPSRLIRQRKPELDLHEIERQLLMWRAIASDDPDRCATLDASRPAVDVIEQAIDHINDKLAARQRAFEACALPLRCLGGLRVGGTEYAIISAPRRPTPRAPRWVLPTGAGVPGPIGMQLYRPARARHLVAAVGFELLHRSGAIRLGARITVDPDRGLAPVIAEALGASDVLLAAAVTGDRRRGERTLLSVWSEGRVIAFAKVALQEGEKLWHEARVLRTLAKLDLTRLEVPKVIDAFTWQDCTVLLLKPFAVRHRADRPMTSAERLGLAEIAELRDPLASVLGRADGAVPVHGDFAPWNCAPLGRTRLALWDWEETRLGLPLEDLFHWRLERLLRFGRGEPAELVASAVHPDPEVRFVCAELGVDSGIAPQALSACLRRRFGTDGGPSPMQRTIEQAISELGRATA